MYQTCPLCRQQIPYQQMAAHEEQHRRLATVGVPTGVASSTPLAIPHGPTIQPTLTAPQVAPYRGGTPQVFVHKACSSATMIPPEYVRNYLHDPFVFPDAWPCSGCQRPVATSELFWEGTQTTLLEYGRQLRIEYIQEKGLNPADFDWGPTGPMRRAVVRKSDIGGMLATTALVGGVVLVGCVMLGVGVYLFASVMPDGDANTATPTVVTQPAGNNGSTVAAPPPPVASNGPAPYTPPAIPSPMIPSPPSFEPPSFRPPTSSLGPGGTYDPRADINRQLEESRQRSEQMRRESEERMREIQDRMRRRSEELRSRFGP